MLAEHEDAFGRGLLAEHEGQPTVEIIERDDGYFDSIPLVHYFEPFEAFHPDTRAAMDRLRGRVLDVGVGAGRHALALQERGHDVVGIDVSPLALEVARRRGLRDARGCAATEVSAELGRFDAVILMGNNFGLMRSARTAPWLLRRLARLTSPKALLVAQTTNVYATDNPAHLAYQARNRERGRMSGQIRLRVRYQRYCTPFIDYLMVSPEEMEALVERTPWRIAQILGDPALGPYTALLEKRA